MSQTPSVSDHRLPALNVNKSIDPTAAYKNKPGRKPILHTSAGLVINLMRESPDAFTPLKSVARCLSAVLKYCDVRHLSSHTYPFILLTLELASGGEP